MKKAILIFYLFILATFSIRCSNLFSLYSDDKHPEVKTRGLFIAVGSNSVIFYSEYGRKWSNNAGLGLGGCNLRGICNNSKIYVAVGEAGTDSVFAYSYTGKKWFYSLKAGTSIDLYDVAYANGLFVAVGKDGLNGYIYYSEDGINWSSNTAPSGIEELWGICYGNGKFVAVGGNTTGPNIILTSTDGKNWSHKSTGSANYYKSVVYGNGVFVALPDSGATVLYSTDGNNWTQTGNIDSSFTSSYIYYAQGYFYLDGGIHSKIFRSRNGKNWSFYTSNRFTAGCFGDGIHVTVYPSDSVNYSKDGIVWSGPIDLGSNLMFKIIYTRYSIECP